MQPFRCRTEVEVASRPDDSNAHSSWGRRILSSQLCKPPLPTEPVTWEGVAARLLGKWSAREEREAAGVACLSAR